ncbi:hypothetical protein SteCoe_28722 [Stentor coeruleus]|uniref:Bromo domain-containing protein n=1 Tax=Stentor coeruleus TaxID=5963 RepID=A0A1R2B7J6_9CILI|nr:hypothetical protein SteCoe_28722 [Stentor coeruleus]
MKMRQANQKAQNPDFVTADKLISFLKAQEECIDFLMPVDTSKLGIPIYKKIIKNPMDINTICLNLKQMKYENINQVLDDINLIWENCRIFNQSKSPIVIRANIMDKKCKDYCIQNSILPIKRLRSNTKNECKTISETNEKKTQSQNTKPRFFEKKQNSLKAKKNTPQTFKVPATPLKNAKNSQALKEKIMSQPIYKQILTENCESIETEDYFDSEEFNNSEYSESSYEQIKVNKTANNIETKNIPRSRQIELKEAISITTQKKFNKIMQVLRLRAPDAFDITRDSLDIFIEKLMPQTFEEIWKIIFDP